MSKDARATHYTIREGGDWYSWRQRHWHEHRFPACIRFANGWIFDCLTNSWRQEGVYPPKEPETCTGCGRVEAHCDCPQFDSERK